jgi:putative chitinase
VPQRVAVTRTYQVRPGETLTGIAQRFGTTPAALANLNGLKKPLNVKSGQVLTLPAAAAQQVVAKHAPRKAVPGTERRLTASQPKVVPAVRRVAPRTYKVRSGDTLTEIAQRFGTTVKTLVTLNGLKKPVIKPGQILTLPPAAAPGTVAEGAVPQDTVRFALLTSRTAMA